MRPAPPPGANRPLFVSTANSLIRVIFLLFDALSFFAILSHLSASNFSLGGKLFATDSNDSAIKSSVRTHRSRSFFFGIDALGPLYALLSNVPQICTLPVAQKPKRAYRPRNECTQPVEKSVLQSRGNRLGNQCSIHLGYSPSSKDYYIFTTMHRQTRSSVVRQSSRTL